MLRYKPTIFTFIICFNVPTFFISATHLYGPLCLEEDLSFLGADGAEIDHEQ